MKGPKNLILLQLFLAILLIVVLYFAFVTLSLKVPSTVATSIVQEAQNLSFIHSSPVTTPRNIINNDFNIWLIFTKVNNKSSLTYKFGNLVHNLLNVTSVPLRFHILVDEKSKGIAQNKLSEVVYRSNKSLVYTFYDVQNAAAKIQDIVRVMTPFFSSKPGTYYSDALFYISLGLYRVAPLSQKRAILLDCDLFFKKDVALLFEQFNSFKPTALFGLAPELSPVYRHILHMYKLKHKTTFGDFYHQRPISPYKTHPQGFQGYNSGVVMINFVKLRTSKEFPKVISKLNIINMTEKYRFRGHLGDQDFYTMLGYEFPHLIQTIHCGFNRQLCTWWKDHGYREIFDYYFQCEHPVMVLHGNCNTKLPRV
ncbi:xyloside xylosyltransferase 1-like [Anthonomus grandis grandis]|uniref:xyloside xylosyltransferase 1-like n=1 Tax=Anthonomus grandis grandis TaxID=2921223 RepID=UPI0021659795|nr:xyloside xylosyltransferase 1-like [Anthonomus grandis grandis]